MTIILHEGIEISHRPSYPAIFLGGRGGLDVLRASSWQS